MAAAEERETDRERDRQRQTETERDRQRNKLLTIFLTSITTLGNLNLDLRNLYHHSS